MLVPRRIAAGAPLRVRVAAAAARRGPAVPVVSLLQHQRRTQSATAAREQPESFDDALLHPTATLPRGLPSYNVAEGDVSPAPYVAKSGMQSADADGAEHEEWTPREERRSPAAVFSTNRIGMSVLPEELVTGIDAALAEGGNSRDVRNAYLHILEPATKEKVKGGSKNSLEHGLARAAAILPAQVASTRTVMEELNRRLGGGLVGPILEVSGGLGPGLWASVEAVGPQVAENYALVHRKRHGLMLAERFAEPIDQPMQFRRDIVLVELAKYPQVALSSFNLSTLPKVAGRRAHLRQLLSFNPEHIVLIERAGAEPWAVLKEAREFLLAESTDENPWHITAPCPHDEGCPRTDGKEACMFVQRLQRPSFLRRTKHAKRGEEDMSYTYLIMSRGNRPQADTPDDAVAGRTGGVGREAAASAAAKAAGHVELHEVEGGDGFEMVNIAGAEPVQTEAVDPSEPALAEQLRKEAYSWPRLLAPVMKRSGHVVMDACTAEGNIQRWRVAKSHGKQEYFDARKLDWGDLYPHPIRGKTEVRDRGVRRLTKEETEVDDDLDLREFHNEEVEVEDPETTAPSTNLEDQLQDTNAETQAMSEAALKAADEMMTQDPQMNALVHNLPPDLQKLLFPDGIPELAEGAEAAFGDAKPDEAAATAAGNATAEPQPVTPELKPTTTSGVGRGRNKGRRGFSTSARVLKPEEDVDEDCALGDGGFSASSFSEPKYREVDEIEDLDEDCALGDGGFSQGSLSDPDYKRPEGPAYVSARPARPDGPIAKDKDTDAASSLEGCFSRSSLSDPKFRAVDEHDDVDEDCAVGEGGFSYGSLSDPDFARPEGGAEYSSPRPPRPRGNVYTAASEADFRPASMKRPWTSALADPPMRATDDHPVTSPGSTPVADSPEDAVAEDFAPGDGGFTSESLADLDLEPPAAPKPYTAPSGPDAKDKDADAASTGDGYMSRATLNSLGKGSQKRSFSTVPQQQLRGFASSARVMSVRPTELTGRPKVNVGALQAMHESGTPITVLTAYDYPTAMLIARAGVDIALVGDSLSQVALGHPSTTQLTLEEMIHHVHAVARGAAHAFIIADLPFGYAQASVDDGVRASVKLIKAGADAVKIEGGREMLPLIRRLAETGVPVMPHIGLQPQRAAATGFKAQARSAQAAVDLLETAKQCEEAGGFGLLLEAIPHQVAKLLTERSGIPTIGIGAGNATSGQVLVLTDMLGTYDMVEDDNCPLPRFVRKFGDAGRESRRAVDAYIASVKTRDYPATGKETYGMPKDELEMFLSKAGRKEAAP